MPKWRNLAKSGHIESEGERLKERYFVSEGYFACSSLIEDLAPFQRKKTSNKSLNYKRRPPQEEEKTTTKSTAVPWSSLAEGDEQLAGLAQQ